MPDVKMIDPTPNFENSSTAIPGLKHHQLKVLDGLPATPNTMKMFVNLEFRLHHTNLFGGFIRNVCNIYMYKIILSGVYK